MRSSGHLATLSARPHSHICWLFEGDDSFARNAVEFLIEGAARGERLVYVADRPSADALRTDLAGLGDVDALAGEGSLLLRQVGEMYGASDTFDVAHQASTYRRVVAEALHDGYAGVRVAADATLLASRKPDRRRFLRYELAVDRLMAELPMTALCGYDRSRLGDDALELATVHPECFSASAGSGGPGFRFYYDGERLRLAGEIDLVDRALFPTALDAVAGTDEPEIVLDLADLEFVDAAGLSDLDRFAGELRATGRSLRIVRPSTTVRRCCGVLRLAGLETAMSEGGAAA